MRSIFFYFSWPKENGAELNIEDDGDGCANAVRLWTEVLTLFQLCCLLCWIYKDAAVQNRWSTDLYSQSAIIILENGTLLCTTKILGSRNVKLPNETFLHKKMYNNLIKRLNHNSKKLNWAFNLLRICIAAIVTNMYINNF